MYMNMIKNTDGLVSAAPSCVKALDKLKEHATEANLKAAIHAVEAQKKELEKSLKADDKAARSITIFDFRKAIDGLAADLKKIAKAVSEIQAALR
jgi:hypothetical protein